MGKLLIEFSITMCKSPFCNEQMCWTTWQKQFEAHLERCIRSGKENLNLEHSWKNMRTLRTMSMRFFKFAGQFLNCTRENPAFVLRSTVLNKSFSRGWHSFGVWINVLVWIKRVLMLFWGTFPYYFCLNYLPLLSIIYMFSNYDFQSWTMHKWCEKWALPHGATQDTGWFLTLPWRVLSTKR